MGQIKIKEDLITDNEEFSYKNFGPHKKNAEILKGKINKILNKS